MKRNFLLKGVILSTIVSALLTGCSSVEDSINEIEKEISKKVEEQIQIAISGKAVDGYLQNAVVCLDLNQDGYCQASSEPITTTLDDGSFKLEITQAHRENSNFNEALLLVFGGVDVDTGKDFRGKLFAPNDGSTILNVSPITTLIAKNLKLELADQKLTKEQIREKIKEAKAKVADMLDIPEEDLGADPIAFQKKYNDDKLIRNSLKIQKSIEALMIAAGIEGSDQDDKIDEIYEILAQAEGVRGVDKLFEQAVKDEKFKKMFKNQDHDQMLRITDAVSQNLDTSFDQVEVGDDQLERIAAITRESFDDIREGVKSDNPNFIEGIIFVKDDHRFEKKFDWIKEHIKHDLIELGVKPTPSLINKLKAIYKNGFHPGTLLQEAEVIKNSNDIKLRELYKAILEYRADIKREKEAQEAKYNENDINLKNILAGNIFYIISESEECEIMEDRREKCELYIEKIVVNDDASEADSDNGVQELIFDKNGFFIIGEDEKTFLTYKDDTDKYLELYENRGHIIKLFKNMNSAEEFLEEGEQKREIEEPELDNNYPIEDEKEKIKIEKPELDIDDDIEDNPEFIEDIEDELETGIAKI